MTGSRRIPISDPANVNGSRCVVCDLSARINTERRMNTSRIYLACSLSRGSFSGEVIFRCDMFNSERYTGVAPLVQCRSKDDSRLHLNDLPANSQETLDGKVVASLIKNGGKIARVALPDGEAIEVSIDLVSERVEKGMYVPV